MKTKKIKTTLDKSIIPKNEYYITFLCEHQVMSAKITKQTLNEIYNVIKLKI